MGVITLNRPERKNPLTFESYAELRDLFLRLQTEKEVKAIVIGGAGGNFCSGGDVHEIIGPLTKMQMPELFLFTRVGLAGCDMGACTILPRIIGQGRAAELLYSGRSMSAEEGFAWGFFNRLASPSLQAAMEMAQSLAAGPTFAHGMTKTMLHQEWNVGVDEAIEMEAQAQAICMQTQDFRRAFEAFAAKKKPVFEGN